MPIKTLLPLTLATLSAFLLISLNYSEAPKTPELFKTNIDLAKKTIDDVPHIDADLASISFLRKKLEKAGDWLSQNFNAWRLYQNLANPSSRYVVLNSGLRKEQIASILSKELKWNEAERYAFLITDQKVNKRNMEGYYNPGGYLLPISAKPLDAYQVIIKRFNQEVRSRYATSTDEIINMTLAIKIASIIEREAGGKHDMKLISGIIWNRIFKDMNLEMDATLQYAKGSNKNGWWPRVLSEDKYIDSPYNTYKNKGLPPTPISNVSIAAIEAALNPQKTKCIFYLHDKRGDIHCSVTYKEHQAKIKRYYR